MEQEISNSSLFVDSGRLQHITVPVIQSQSTRSDLPSLDPSRSEHPSGQPLQRVALTSSMLYAYAAMRGNFDEEYPQSSDPLHTSLYMLPLSTVHPRFDPPANLLSWQLIFDPGMFLEPPLGATLYQDVSAPMYSGPAPTQLPTQHDNSGPKILSHEVYKADDFSRFLPKHYTGNDGYGNYGYLNVNGCWIDPDGKKEIADAENDLLGAKHAPRISIAVVSPPKLTEDQMYVEFMDEVAHGLDGDLESDPRSMYITAATFARWAVGASRGDHYVSQNSEISGPRINQRHSCKRFPPKPMVKSQLQIDEDNGSTYSGEYTPESSPSMIRSPRGVDMSAQPGTFSYMNPEMRVYLDRAAYGDPKATPPDSNCHSSSAGSKATIFFFEEEDMVKDLAGSEGSETGWKAWNEYTRRIETLVKEHKKIQTDNAPKHARRSSLELEHFQIYKEAYFMEGRIMKRETEIGSVPPTSRPSVAKTANRPTPIKAQFHPKPRDDIMQTPTRASRTKDSQGFLQLDNKAALPRLHYTKGHAYPHFPGAPTRSRFRSISTRDSKDLTITTNAVSNGPSHSQTKRLLRKQRIERYFMEQEELQIININKVKAMNVDVEVELKELAEAMQGMSAVHESLRDDLGIQDVSEIPDLIPVRKKKPRPFDSSSEESDEGEGEERGEG